MRFITPASGGLLSSAREPRALQNAFVVCIFSFLFVSLLHAQTVGYEFDQLNLQELPNTGRVWSILENQAPTTVTEPLDLGGLETGSVPFFGSLGASWTENQYLLNGFDITDPYVPGRPLIDPNLDALGSIRVISAAKPAVDAGSGTNVELFTPSPSEELHGTAAAFFTGDSLQANRALSEQFNHFVDGSFHLTGNVANKKPFFISVFSQDLSKTLDRFPASIDGNTFGVLGTVTPYVHDDHRIDLLFSAQHLLNSHAGATPQTDPQATTRDSQNSETLQFQWKNTNFNAGFGLVHASLTSDFQDGAGTSILELPQRILSGGSPLVVDGSRTRYQFIFGSKKKYRDHDLQFGASYDWSSIQNRWLSNGQQIVVDGTPAENIVWNAPAETSEHIQNFAAHIEDQWRPFEWLTLPVGLRLDVSRGGGISWTSLQPKAIVQIQPWKDGLAFIGSWSRYGHLLQGRYLDFGNPQGLSYQIFNGAQVISRYGGAYSAIDPNLKQPYTNEITAGAEQRFSENWMMGVRFFRRDDHDLIGLVNTGVPFSTYTPVNVLDPGNDGIAGNSDDQILTLFNRNPATFGQDFLLLTNPSDRSNMYKGFQIQIARTFDDRWMFSVVFSGCRAFGPTNTGNGLENDVGVMGNLGTDPNSLVYANSATFFDRGYLAKLIAYYRWSSGFHVGVVARYYDGLAFGRLLFVQGFNQGPFFVRATQRDDFPLGFRTQFNATMDVRVAYPIHNLTAYVDCFNLFNLNRRTKENDLTGVNFSTRIPLAIQAPLAVRLGVRWSF